MFLYVLYTPNCARALHRRLTAELQQREKKAGLGDGRSNSAKSRVGCRRHLTMPVGLTPDQRKKDLSTFSPVSYTPSYARAAAA